MLSTIKNRLLTALIFSILLGSRYVFAAPVPAGAPVKSTATMDSFKSSKTVTVMEKQVRIKREKVTLLKPGALQNLMIGLYEDNRLEKFIEILKKMVDDEADSCPYCWSTYSRLQSSAVSVLQKASKGYLKLSDGKKRTNNKVDKGKEDTTKNKAMPKRREPHTKVVDSAQQLFAQVLDTPEETGIKNAMTILVDELKLKENKTPGEHDYFSVLADAMYMPFLGEVGEEDDEHYDNDNS